MRRVGREVAADALFPTSPPKTATNSLYRALSMARAALANLGGAAGQFLQADRTLIWADPNVPLEVDYDLYRERLARALRTEPGPERENLLRLALADESTLLEDEPYADWTVFPREELERSRQEARLALARDRGRGLGHCTPEAVLQGWEACLSHDPSSEEAASALVRLYGAQKRASLVEATYKRCCAALEELGLRASPALEQVYMTSRLGASSSHSSAGPGAAPGPRPQREERRLVTVLYADLTWRVITGQSHDPEELRGIVGGALAGLVGNVESLGGTISSISGAGLVALFGAPAAHEDDPERALRAAYRSLVGLRDYNGSISARFGIETGQVVVGPCPGTGRTTARLATSWPYRPDCSPWPNRPQCWSGRPPAPAPRGLSFGAPQEK